jgi:flagellar hook-length control protein FliK
VFSRDTGHPIDTQPDSPTAAESAQPVAAATAAGSDVIQAIEMEATRLWQELFPQDDMTGSQAVTPVEAGRVEESGDGQTEIPTAPIVGRSSPAAVDERRAAPQADLVHRENLAEHVTRAIEVAHRSGHTMHVELFPRELGAVAVEVNVDNGVLTASLFVQSHEARQLLHDCLPELTEALTRQGLQVERLQVELADSRPGDLPSWGSGNPGGARQEQDPPVVWQEPVEDSPDKNRNAEAAARRRPMTSLVGQHGLDVMI